MYFIDFVIRFMEIVEIQVTYFLLLKKTEKLQTLIINI